MKEKYKYLSKNVLLFTLSGFIPKILAFILIPVYTGYLSTADYGVSDLITTTSLLLVPIFTLDIQDAVMRYAFDINHDNKSVLSVAISIIIKGGMLVLCGAVLLSLFEIRGLEPMYLFFTVLYFFTNAFSNTFSLFCRGIEKVKTLTVASILNSVIMLSANIVFLMVLNMGLLGFLIANSIGALISIGYMFYNARLWEYIDFDISSQTKKDMITFSIPLIFSVIAWWLNNASDRYILAWISGVSISGIYSIAYKIPSLLSMFQGIFTQAWSISAIKEFDKNDTDSFIGNTYTLMNGTMVILCSVILIINIPIASILYSRDFFSAWIYVPPLLVSVLFNAMALFIGSLFTAVKDTKTLAMSTIVGALVNTVFNFILIYYFQAMGAAIATLIGYLVTFVMRHIMLRKHILMKINISRDILAYLILICQMIVACFGLKYVFFQIALTITLMGFYHKEIRKILEKIFSKIRKHGYY